MKITDIKKQVKREDRFSVFIDGKYELSLTADELLREKVKIGIELRDQELEKLRKASQDSVLLAKSYDKCLRRPHSEKEIVDYLRKNKAGEETIEYIIDKCKLNNLLNDEFFAETWVAMRRKQGRSNLRIRQELAQKGISSEVIDQFAADADANRAALDELIKKRSRSYPDQKKFIAYLQRQGYGYYDIVDALKED